MKPLRDIDPAILYRLFNPQVPVVVCSKYKENVAAMPANSCMSLSHSPSIIGLAIQHHSKTNSILRQSSNFSMNWMSFFPKRSRDVILKLAQPTPKDSCKDKLKHYKIPYRLIDKTPVLGQAQAYALCKVNRIIKTGDHDFFIASAEKLRVSQDFQEYWRFEEYRPVLYLGSIRKDPLITIPKVGFGPVASALK